MAYESDYQTPSRMQAKLDALPKINWSGARVLDVGCEGGWWLRHALENGAAAAVGVDRGRDVRGQGFVNLAAEGRAREDGATYIECEVGRQWPLLAKPGEPFDVVLVQSVYHHIYQCTGGDHASIFFWLWQHCSEGATLIWEGPTTPMDSVVARHVDPHLRAGYSPEAITEAASRYFSVAYHGAAGHDAGRQVYVMTPLRLPIKAWAGDIVAGAGGATKAFEYQEGARMRDIEKILGARPVPGSLNVEMSEPFNWDSHYYRAQLLDVATRSMGLNSPWVLKWARFYPLVLDEDVDAWAFRFEGEKYPENFVELIAPQKLRDAIRGEHIMALGVE